MDSVDESLDGTTEDKKEESLRISLRGWMKQRDDAQVAINDINDKLRRMRSDKYNLIAAISKTIEDSPYRETV